MRKLERSEIEFYLSIVICILLAILPMTLLLRCIGLLTVGILLVDVSLRSAFTINRPRWFKVTLSIAVLLLLAGFGRKMIIQPSLAFVDNPSLDVWFDSTVDHEAFNFTNRGAHNLYLWGDRLGDGPKSIDTPRTITPGGSYHIWAQELAKGIRQKMEKTPETRINFEVYISTEDERKYVVTYELWVRVIDGVLNIETQNMGSKQEDFTH